mmetsp:Transcript_2504/g.5947  ORF Transcript_2504/g.5947 Transcript_2504/m.5947 type:complete len:361 (+) Transcript_2504:190-1272(+)
MRLWGGVRSMGLAMSAVLVLGTVSGAASWAEPMVDLSMARTAPQPRTQVNGVARSSSTIWFEGYKAGCMQFLQTYIPDQRDGTPMVIGIAGGSGSGKTTIKDVIVEQLGAENVCVLPHDNYYRHRPDLSDEERDRINFDHPESLETELMAEHLEKLRCGEAVDIPVYDFATHLRKQGEKIKIEPRPIILVEGILILHEPVLRDQINLKVFVDVEADRRLIRRIDRDMGQRGRSFASVVHQYLATVKPMHDAFVEPSKQFSDLIVPFGGRNVAAIQVLLERLHTHIRNDFAFKASIKAGATSDGSSSSAREISPNHDSTPLYPQGVNAKSFNDICLPIERTLSMTSDEETALREGQPVAAE